MDLNYPPLRRECLLTPLPTLGFLAFPDAVAGAKHIHRTLKPSGTAQITTWKHPGNIFFVNQVLQILSPGIAEWFPLKEWTQGERLRNVLEKGGFAKGEIEICERRTVWNVDDFEKTVGLFNRAFFDQAKGGLSEELKDGWEGAVRKVLRARNGEGIDMIAWVGVARK